MGWLCRLCRPGPGEPAPKPRQQPGNFGKKIYHGKNRGINPIQQLDGTKNNAKPVVASIIPVTMSSFFIAPDRMRPRF